MEKNAEYGLYKEYFSPLKVIAAYILTGSLWILLTDFVLATLIRDYALFARLQIYKGWFYVLVTALLFYWLLNRHVLRQQLADRKMLHANRLYAVLSQVNEAIVRIRDRDSLFQEICRILIDVGLFRTAWIDLVDEVSGFLEPVAFCGIEEKYLREIRLSINGDPAGRLPTATALREGRHFVCNDMDTFPRFAPWADEAVRRGYRSCAAFPIKIRGRLVGALNIYESEPNFFSGDETSLIGKIAADISFAMEHMEEELQRTRAMEALYDSERNFRMLFENNPLPMWVYDRDTLAFLAVNDAAVHHYGYSRKEFFSMTIRDIHLAEKVPDLLKAIEAIPGTLRKPGVWKQVKKDGSLIDVEITTHDLSFSGKRARLVLAVDVTEQTKMEAEIYRVKQDWEETFDTITDMITIHDRDFNIVRSNKASEEIRRLSLLETGREKCFRYYHATGRPPEECPSCRCVKEGLPGILEMFEPHLNKFLEIRAVPRFDADNNIIGLIHIVRDITEQKKLEIQLRQAQKMEAVGLLARGIAHDFNNILTAIIGYGNLLRIKMVADDPLKLNIDHILSLSEKAADLIQGLLAFSRQQLLNPRLLDVNEIIRRLEKLLVRIIGEDIEFRTVLSGEALTVLADGGQIEQVLMNLCANARDAMPDGGFLTVETQAMTLGEDYIRAHGYGEIGEYALISVADTGKGMDEKTRERVFEPFFTTKEMGRGTGLGLSVVYGIVRRHNGYINVYSEPDKGTTFRIYLPLVKARPWAEKPPVAAPHEKGEETILLAEDDPDARQITRIILEESGYNVIEAADGEEALRAFSGNKDRIELLLLDVIMPRKNGKEVFEEIRKVRPDIKALFASGYTADVVHKKGILEEGLAFYSKPVPPNELLRKVREVLGRVRPEKKETGE